MKRIRYTYKFTPEFYNFILHSNILNKKKNEHQIFQDLVAGYTCEEIGKKRHYSVRTIKNRRREIYYKTEKYMTN